MTRIITVNNVQYRDAVNYFLKQPAEAYNSLVYWDENGDKCAYYICNRCGFPGKTTKVKHDSRLSLFWEPKHCPKCSETTVVVPENVYTQELQRYLDEHGLNHL